MLFIVVIKAFNSSDVFDNDIQGKLYRIVINVFSANYQCLFALNDYW